MHFQKNFDARIVDKKLMKSKNSDRELKKSKNSDREI